MKTTSQTHRVRIPLAVLAAALLLAGCHEMKVQTTLNTDGGGVREMTLQVEVDEGDTTMTLDDYRQLMNVTEARGWSHKQTRRKAKESGEVTTRHSFARREKAANIVELAGMTGDIHIVGSNRNTRFEDVYFINSIDVETGMSPRGRTLSYRETFSWTGMTEALLDYRLERFRPQLQRTHPTLHAAAVDEWFAFFKGSFLAAVDDGIFDLEKEERARRFAKSIDRVVSYATDMIERNESGVGDSLVVRAVRSVFVEWDEFDQTAEDMDLMGVVLATVLDLTVRVDVPGRIVQTNADRREQYTDAHAGRQVLVWDIDPTAAVTAPIEIYVKSEIPNQ
jgi:hypothetical protein